PSNALPRLPPARKAPSRRRHRGAATRPPPSPLPWRSPTRGLDPFPIAAKSLGGNGRGLLPAGRLLVITTRALEHDREKAGPRTRSGLGIGSPKRSCSNNRLERSRRGRWMARNNGAIRLVAGNSNQALAEAIGAHLATPLAKAVVRRFADMEVFVEILENVRGADVFVVQSTSFPANDHLMELLIIIDALRRAS